MNFLLLGSGGREHAMAWKLAQSPRLAKLYIAPGNAGTQDVGTNLDIDPLDFPAIKEFVLSNGIHLVIVGPEAPLVAGISDFFKADERLRYVPVIGPSKAGAELEGSKDFSKAFMMRHGIPTAQYHSFTPETIEQGLAFLETLEAPYVLKADGLAAGKGVLICEELVEARVELTSMLLDAKFGEASKKVVIEEFLRGIELSVFVLTDGKNYRILPAAKDYKRIGEGDTGLNTGGMGAVSPVPFADEAFIAKVEERVVKPTIAGLNKDGIDYVGFIFIGLMTGAIFPPLEPSIFWAYGMTKISAAAWYCGSWLLGMKPVMVTFWISCDASVSFQGAICVSIPPTHRKLILGRALAIAVNRSIPRPG